MLIQLKQAAIEKAIVQYLSSKGIDCQGAQITFTATRGQAGILADIEVPDSVLEADTPAEYVTKADAKPVEEQPPAAEPVDEPAPALTGKSIFG